MNRSASIRAHSKNATTNDALLFIPDISGFTQFVNSTEIDHAKHIIEELLEVIIDSNDIGLELSEIEGDALLFYRPGKAPTAAELLAQIQKMYVNFHSHLKRYETHRICNCGACCSATDLSLKFVAHYGEVASNTIKDHTSLFGKDVIVAHRLLKNNVDSNEYGLFSNKLVKACSTWIKLNEVAWDSVQRQEEEYDFGKTTYCFIGLEALSEHVPEPSIEDYTVPGLTSNILSSEAIIEAPLELVFDVVSDMAFRHEWMPAVKDSDLINHKTAQNGSRHRCVIKGDKSDPTMIAHNFTFDQDTISFVETNHRDNVASVWMLKSLENGHTKIAINTYMKPNMLMKLMFNLFMKKKHTKMFEESAVQLNDYCKQLVLEEKQHPNRIVLQADVAA